MDLLELNAYWDWKVLNSNQINCERSVGSILSKFSMSHIFKYSEQLLYKDCISYASKHFCQPSNFSFGVRQSFTSTLLENDSWRTFPSFFWVYLYSSSCIVKIPCLFSWSLMEINNKVILAYACRALRKEDGTFAPAHMLADNRLERAGRVASSTPRVRASVFVHVEMLCPSAVRTWYCTTSYETSWYNNRSFDLKWYTTHLLSYDMRLVGGKVRALTIASSIYKSIWEGYFAAFDSQLYFGHLYTYNDISLSDRRRSLQLLQKQPHWLSLAMRSCQAKYQMRTLAILLKSSSNWDGGFVGYGIPVWNLQNGLSCEPCS